MGVKYTSLGINNAYIKSGGINRTPSLIKLGNNVVWPKAKVVEFTTLQQGGSLDFTVGSDTKYVAVTVDDADVYIFSSTAAEKNYIRAASSTYSERYTMSNSYTPIAVSIPLYVKKDAIISGVGTRINKYNADYYQGQIQVRIRLGIGNDNNYTIGVTGKSNITKTVRSGQGSDFIFSGLPAGDKTVTITNNTTNDVFTRTVNVNGTRSAIKSQTHTMASSSAEKSIGSIPKTIKIYSLTQQEAINNLQASYGSDAVIGIDCKPMLSKPTWRPEGPYSDKIEPWWFANNFTDGGTKHNYWIVFFKIIHPGYGYPSNRRIGVIDMGITLENDDFPASGWTAYFDFGKGFTSSKWFFRHCDLITNSDGSVYNINRDYEADKNYIYHRRNNFQTPTNQQALLLSDSTRLEQLDFTNMTTYDYYHDTTFGTIQRNNRRDITTDEWRPTAGPRVRSNNVYDAPFDRIPNDQINKILYWNDIPYDFYYTAANNYANNSSSEPPIRWLKSACEDSSGRPIRFPGADGRSVQLVWTGEHFSAETAQLDGGKWFDNLLLDENSEGNIESIELGDINVTEIIVQSQPLLKVIQSDFIPTTTDRLGSNKVRISASTNFQTMHGSGIDYSYTDS